MVDDGSEVVADGLEEEELDKPEPKPQVKVGSSKRLRSGIRSGIMLGEQIL